MEGVEALTQLYHQALYSIERGVAKALGVDPALLDYASKRPTEFGFREDSRTDYDRNYQDAMRHILLSGELQRTHPNLAGPLLQGHEYVSGTLHGQSRGAESMDLENNKLGRALGRQARSRQELELMALNNLPWARVMNNSPFGFRRQ